MTLTGKWTTDADGKLSMEWHEDEPPQLTTQPRDPHLSEQWPTTLDIETVRSRARPAGDIPRGINNRLSKHRYTNAPSTPRH
jgi:hypothetical protein